MPNFTFKIDPELKRKSLAFAKEHGISLSEIVKAMLRQFVRTGKIPSKLYPEDFNEI